MTNLKYFQKLFFLLVMGFSLSLVCACSDDKKDEPVDEPDEEKTLGITGTWRYEFSSGYSYLYFGKTGFGWEHEYDEDDGGWYEKDRFTYVYDATEKRIAIKWEDGYSEVVVVSALSEDRMALEDFGDSGLNFYDRVSDGEYKTGDEEDEPEPKPEPDKTKRLVKMTKEEYDDKDGLHTKIRQFDYNNNGKLISVTEYDNDGTIDDIYSITYSENAIISTEREDGVSEVDNVVTFKLSDGKIIFGLEDFSSFSYSHSYSYNSNYLIETTGGLGYTTFTWSGNKLMKVYENIEDDEDEYIFEYDGQTCKGYNPAIVLPFAHSIIYEGEIFHLIANPELIGFKTNSLPKSAKCGDEIIHFTYELNDDGYLRKCSIVENNGPSYEAYTFNWE